MQNPQVAEFELYKRLKLLGEGAFGKAYLVESLQDGNKWVTKYMDLNAMTKQEKDETIKEAKILELLNHPNIVKFKEVYQTNKGKLCIVMEYADGADLAKKVKDAKNQNFPETQILDWLTQISLALKHVHDRKILHRDLKGQNIFLTKDNRVKLGDFGIARVLNKTMEKAKTMVGTPYYISPEIIEAKPYSFMSDIWSLGVILYELCALKPPFNADSLHFLALKIVRGQYSPIPNQYSRELKNLIGQMLQVDPRKRPSIQEVLKQPIILNRIKGFLTESVRHSEFSHTIIHNHVFKPVAGLQNVKQVINELPCPPSLLPQKSSGSNQDQKKQESNSNAPTQPSIPIQAQKPPQYKPPQQQNQVEKDNQPALKPPVIAMTPQNQSRPDPRNNNYQQQNQIPQLLQQQRAVTPQKQNILQQPQLQSQPQAQKIIPQQQQPQIKQQPQQQVNKPQQQMQQQIQQIQKPPSQQQFQEQKQIPQSRPLSNQGNKPSGDGMLIINPVFDNRQQRQPVQKQQPVIQQAPRPVSRGKKQAIVDEAFKQKQEEERQKFQKLKLESENKRKEEEKRRKDKEQQKMIIKEQTKADQKLRREEQQKFMRDDLAKKRNQNRGPSGQNEDYDKQTNQENQSQTKDEELLEYFSDSEEEKYQKQNNQPKQGVIEETKSTEQKNQQMEEYYSDDEDQNNNDVGIAYDEEIKEDPLIKELQALLQEMNNAVIVLPDNPEAQKFFNSKTLVLENPLVNRQDDDDEVQVNVKPKEEKKIRELSKQEDQSLDYLRQAEDKEALRLLLVDGLGAQSFEKALKVLKQQIDQYDFEEIEQQHQKNDYKTLLPFLNDFQRKNYISYLLCFIVQ